MNVLSCALSAVLQAVGGFDMNLISKTIKYYREGKLISRAYGRISRLARNYLYIPILVLYCSAYDYINKTEDGLCIMICLRHDSFDATSISLLSRINDMPVEEIEKIVFSVQSKERYERKSTPVKEFLSDELGDKVVVTEKDSIGFVHEYSQCNALVLTSKDDLWLYRYFSPECDRLIVHIHHGVLTKSIGNLTNTKIREQRTKTSTAIDPNPYGLKSQLDHVDVKPIASEVERLFHSAGEAESPGLFKKWGYPRHYRLRQLREIPLPHRILPEGSIDELNDDRDDINLLYAPTHWDGRGVHPFRLPDFHLDGLLSVLDEYSINLYMRMHSVEEKSSAYKEFISHDRIKYAGYWFSPSSIEILDFFDGLVTDYSSIYVDYLLLDRPILFISGEHEHFLQHRGLSFEYDTFFPGPKVGSFDQFVREIQKVAEGIDPFADERKTVRNVLLSETGDSFFERFYEKWTEAAPAPRHVYGEWEEVALPPRRDARPASAPGLSTESNGNRETDEVSLNPPSQDVDEVERRPQAEGA